MPGKPPRSKIIFPIFKHLKTGKWKISKHKNYLLKLFIKMIESFLGIWPIQGVFVLIIIIILVIWVFLETSGRSKKSQGFFRILKRLESHFFFLKKTKKKPTGKPFFCVCFFCFVFCCKADPFKKCTSCIPQFLYNTTAGIQSKNRVSYMTVSYPNKNNHFSIKIPNEKVQILCNLYIFLF